MSRTSTLCSRRARASWPRWPPNGAPSQACGDAITRTGTIYIYRRASEYVFPDRSYFHVADVLWCSDQLGCNWFAGYHRRPDILGSIGEQSR